MKIRLSHPCGSSSPTREYVDRMYAGKPGSYQCKYCKHWYTLNGLEKHKCPSEPFRSPYDIHCLTSR